MSWRDDYQKGSFRGAPFATEYHERSGGRRTIVHEFPGRDDPVAEDLGRRARAFVIECFLAGRDYFAARDRLIDALEAPGPGLLVHPWHGQMQVSVLDFRSTENTEDGGLVRFSIQFQESGVPVATPQAPDAAGRLVETVDSVETAAISDFASGFDVTGFPAFVEDAASELVSAAAELTRFSAGINGGVGPALRAFEAGLSFLPGNIAGLIRQPLALAQSISGLVLAVSALGGTPRARISSLSAMADFGTDPEILPAMTPSRLRQRANRQAVTHLFAVTASAEMVRAAGKAQFASYDDAVGTRDRLSAQLDRLAIGAADLGQDARADRFDALRRAMVRDITARGGSLARVYGHVTPATEPALVIANRLYGHGTAAPRAADIVARNRVRHPGFVAGGREIKVLAYG